MSRGEEGIKGENSGKEMAEEEKKGKMEKSFTANFQLET